MGRPRGAWRRSAGPAVVVAVGLLWARPTDRAGVDAAWRAAWPRPARAPGSPGDAARVVGRARPPRRAPGQRRTLRRARGGEELRPLHRSEFGVLDCGGKWTEPTCPECGSVMLLRKRIQPGRGAGGCFYSCDACNTSVKPVNRKDADRRAKQKSVAIMLRDYQKVDVERVRKAFQDDNWDMVVLSMATGAGKTSVANAYIAQHEGESLVWWTAPSCELLEQAEMNMRRLSPGRNRFRLGLWSVMPDVVELPRSYHQVSPRARTGATVYMTEQLLFRRLAKPRPEVGSSAREGGLEAILPQLLVVDESHWAGLAKTGIVLLKWARFHGVRVLGLSATPRPHPAPLQPIIHSASLVQLASRGVLAWPRLWAVRRRLRESPLRPELVFDMRDHQEGLPDDRVPPAELPLDLAEVVDVYERGAETWGKTLVKVARIQEAVDLVTLCKQRGLRAEAVTTRTDPASRGDIIRRFGGDALDILVVVGIGTFGLDVPALRTIFITTGMNTPIGYVQLIGRGSRRDGDVDHFNVVELHPGLARMRRELWAMPPATGPDAPLATPARFLRFRAPPRPPPGGAAGWAEHAVLPRLCLEQACGARPAQSERRA